MLLLLKRVLLYVQKFQFLKRTATQRISQINSFKANVLYTGQ